MLRTVAVAAALLASTNAAVPQGRPSTPDLSCGQASALVSARGGIVLGTGGSSYDRFVSGTRFCQPTETTEAAFVPTRDQRLCFIGYRCKDRSSDFYSDR